MELFLLCLKIFFCRIIDVSMASYRTVIMVKGKSLLAAIIALIEGTIWFLVVREAITFTSGNFIEMLYIALAYASGFSVGTFVGSWIASRFNGGMVQVQVVTSTKDDDMILKIQEEGYALTVVNIHTSAFSGERYMLLSEIKSSKLKDFRKLVAALDENAFIMVSETKHVFNGFIKK